MRRSIKLRKHINCNKTRGFQLPNTCLMTSLRGVAVKKLLFPNIFIVMVVFTVGCGKADTADSLSDSDSGISEQENSYDKDAVVDENVDENDNDDFIVDENDEEQDDFDTIAEETYRITINLKDNIGSETVVSKNKDEIEVTEAKAGETVTIVAVPDSSRFVLLSVKSPEFTELSDKVLASVDSESSFVMPAEDVEIEATFKYVSNTERIYVKTKAEGKADGSSWNNALDSVQTAIEIASVSGIPEVWIVAGTYYPDSYPFSTVNKHFSLKKNIAVRGGFIGIESDISQRTLKDHHTIFSGNNLSPIIINNWMIDSSSVIDGITFLDGMTDNSGAAISNGSPTIMNCTFINNRAKSGSSGYVISSYELDMTIINSVFVDNGLGVIRKFHGNLRIVNCTFFRNKGVSILAANEITFEIYNSILFNEGDAEFYLYSSCYIGGVIENSLVKNGFQDQFIIGADPLFADVSGDDSHSWDLNLSSDSPCLDNGSDEFMNEEFLNVDLDGNGMIKDVPANLVDVTGNSRFFGEKIDIGAFESVELSTRSVYNVTVTKIDDEPGEDVYINKDQPAPNDYIEIMADTEDDRKVALKVMSDGKEIELKHTVVSKDSKVVFIMPENNVEIVAQFGEFERVYVKEDGTGSGIGWDDALGDVQKAIETASAAGIPEVWIAKGTYYPTSWPSGLTLDEHRHFSLRNNVSVIGGFVGDETSIDERSIGENETILSGYDSGSETMTVLFQHANSVTDETAVLDSVTIRHGYFRSNLFYFEGGGAIMLDSSSATIKNTVFRDNFVLGVGSPITIYLGTLVLENCSVEYTSSSWETRGTIINNYQGVLKIRDSVIEGVLYGNVINNEGAMFVENCVFRDNEFLDGGSIIYNSGKLNISRSLFINNSSKGSGTVINSYHNSISILNSIFVNNTSLNRGGAIFIMSGDLSRIVNCTFYNNTANEPGAIAGTMDALSIYNSILSGDETQIDPDKWESEWEYEYLYPWIVNSLVENEPFVNNWDDVITVDPQFMDVSGTNSDSWDLRLKSSSPCVDSGTVDGFNESVQKYDLNLDGDTEDDISDFFDYLGNERWQGTSVDMGAFEYIP